MRTDWYTRLIRVLAWGFIARSCAPAVLLLVVYGMHLIWALANIHGLSNTPIFNLDVYQRVLPSFIAIMVGAVMFILLALWLQRLKREPIWLQHLTANYYGLCLIWGGYLTGSLSMAAGVVLMGAPLLGFILLERRVVLTAFVVSATTLFLVNLASAYDYIPYSPMLLPPAAQQNSLMWTHSQLLMAAPHLIVDIIIAALLIGQWRLREESARILSLTDTLTGIHNRRSILRKLEREISRSRRRRQPLALALLDLDHFKHINDRWGHPAGDKVLQQCTAAISAEIRGNDVLGRFGGEEFILLLPNTDADQAQQIIERCRQRIQALQIATDQGQSISVTASFGLCCPAEDRPLAAHELIATADEALYQAKDNGRNRIELTQQPTTKTASTAPCPTVKHWHWRNLAKFSMWRLILRNVLGISPVSKAILVAGITCFIACNVIFNIFLLEQVDSTATTSNLKVATICKRIALLVAIISLVNMFVGAQVRERWPGSRLYQQYVLQFFGLSLIGLGYAVGILYLPTGIMLLCSPIVGFMLFERRIVLQVFFVSIACVIGAAYLSAFNIIPYGPLLREEITDWQINNGVVTYGMYYFITFCMIVVFVLVDNILGSWRAREAAILKSSRIDALTQVMNRHSIMRELNEAISCSLRHGESIAVAILDLDHFKQINDRWGHPVGDAVLIHTAQRLTHTLRDSDVIGRIGGEEFLLVLRHVDQAQALALTERCRQSLSEGHVSNSTGGAVEISASFGLVLYAGQSTLSDADLIKAADEALYRAKQGGRNRICTATLTDTPLTA